MAVIIAMLTLVLLALAIPPAVRLNSWPWFFASLILSFLVVVLPLFIFLFSSLLTPDAKDECEHGWVDCFMMGKLALLPLALLATAALYTIEVVRVENRTKMWIVFGISSGAVISLICLAFGLTCVAAGNLKIWMVVPFYVAIWYSLRAVQFARETKLGSKELWGSILGTLPFWFGSVIWSQSTYTSLPDTQQGCFIITAAGHGHRKFVGPFTEIKRHGRRIQANQQLVTFWEFESLWRNYEPCTHRFFRRIYNRFGPTIAAHIQSPWLADLTYIAVKPVEIAVKLAILILRKTTLKNEN